MFIVTTGSGVIEEITPYINYVRLQPNGYLVCCPKEQAAAIYAANSDLFYSTERYTVADAATVPEGVERKYWMYQNGVFTPNPDMAAEHRQRQQAAANLASVPELQTVVNSLLLDQLTAEGAVV